MNEVSPWPLYVALALLGIVVFSKTVTGVVGWDLTRDKPRAQFYSQEAYDNCAAMKDEAKKQGYSSWRCNKPISR